VFLKTEIGLNLKIWVIELLLFTMLNMKKSLNQLIDSLLMIPLLNKLMSINKSTKIGLLSKVTGSISMLVIPTVNNKPLVT
jgi:hypothetical protein